MMAEAEDAEKLYALMQQVYQELEDQSLFVCDDYEYVKTHIEEKGFAIKACNEEGNIVGCFFCGFPGMDEDNLGYDLGWPTEQLCKVAHMDSAVVSEKYRGRGLQGCMLQKAEERLKELPFVYYLATVSPKNPASFRTLEKNGYRVLMTKEKYGGMLRRIYCKKV